MDPSGNPAADPPTTSLWQRLDGIDSELTGLTGWVRRIDTWLEEMRCDLDSFEKRATELSSETPTADRAAAPDPATGPAAEPAPASAEEPADQPRTLDMRVLVPWVRENIALVFQRKIPQTSAPHWCRQWWQHPEAIVRFEALRRDWLVAVREPGAAMADYLTRLDSQMAVLMGEFGPFTGCTGGQHRPDSQSRFLDQDDPGEELYLAIVAANATPPGEN